MHQDEEWLPLCTIPSGPFGAYYHGAPSLLPLLSWQCQHTPDNTPGMSGMYTSSPFPIAGQPVIFDLDKCLRRERHEFSSPDPSDKPTMFLAVLGSADECFSPLYSHHTQSQHLKCCFPGENNCHGKGRSRWCRRDGALGTHGCFLCCTGDVLKAACTSFPQAIFT